MFGMYGGGALIALLFHAYGRRRFRRWNAVISDLCIDLGLETVPGAKTPYDSASYTGDGFTLAVDILRPNPMRSGQVLGSTRIVANAHGQLLSGIELKSCDEDAPASRSDRELGINTGDVGFDKKIMVKGDTAELAGLLDEKTRCVVEKVTLELKGSVSKRRIEVLIPGICIDSSRLKEATSAVRDLAQRLVRSDLDTPGRLAKNALEDSNPNVRLFNLNVLADHFLRSEELKTTAVTALDDEDFDIRLFAARYARDKGRAVLNELVRSNETPSVVRVNAIKTMVEVSFRKDAIPILRNLLEVSGPDWLCRLAAVEGLAQISDNESTPLIGRQIETGPAELDKGVARALGVLDHDDCEALLLRLLENEADEVRIEAAVSLGKIGSIAAVEPLLTHATEGSAGALRKAASGAIDQIQSRLGEVNPGGLSLASDESSSGGLSLSTEEGQLAMVEEEHDDTLHDKNG